MVYYIDIISRKIFPNINKHLKKVDNGKLQKMNIQTAIGNLDNKFRILVE